MKITFMGAARAVTGSCYILEREGVRFAVDCGLHQGNKEIEARNRNLEDYDFENLDFILVTHAHIDHSGLLPAAVSHGYKGPIYMTEPTSDLLDIMLLDSAHIQEMEAEWANRKRNRKGMEQVSPLYTTADAEATTPLFKPVKYGTAFEPADGVTVTFKNAGHILGSAFIEVEYLDEGKHTKLVFSGDLGRPEQLIVQDPSLLDCADYLFLESTYGNRVHKDAQNTLNELAEAIQYSYSKGEKVVIPAFAVERSQQLIYSLFLLHKEGKLPEDMPVYLDSPLAIRATEVFRNHPEFFDEQTMGYIENGENPLDLPNLRLTLSTDESIAINNTPGPAVVISASGMANAGRIKHHLRHNLWRPGASVVFVGYQGVGTMGRRIVNGADKVRIFNEEVAVNAKVFTINGFSGHAGQDELLDWLEGIRDKPVKVILVHGEEKAQDAFAEVIRERFGFDIHIPEYMEELILEPGREMTPVVDAAVARPRVDWEFLVADSEKLFEEFRKRLDDVKERPWPEQTDVRDRLMEVNRAMVELISEM
ncbi:MBL fold metallo-hydrolase RNA specificity domain-containing protein [Desulfovibrio oxyclinae]|uniref:MBL fold metallo-hydrolase RNA specificity domain-containing protein n=1 Tax=Desulfovibrio oxyclinae TaxID=63560 RepID=UPI0003734E99|nr:MBL fold metallo-hydrolase [Desulfovibrio oxyclinae]